MSDSLAQEARGDELLYTSIKKDALDETGVNANAMSPASIRRQIPPLDYVSIQGNFTIAMGT
jgi:hypothetical protein